MLTDVMHRDSKVQALILTGERHHEMTRLRVEGTPYAKSDKPKNRIWPRAK
jgi:hypothetical protein